MPTLLHFAAFYNLRKLAKSLLRCPGAQQTISIYNSNGDRPISVAHFKKHVEIEKLLEAHQVANELVLLLVSHSKLSSAL